MQNEVLAKMTIAQLKKHAYSPSMTSSRWMIAQKEGSEKCAKA
jgi:hypothetical protein